MNIYKKALIYYDKQSWARTVLEGLVGKATDKKVKWYRENDNSYIVCPSCEYSFTDDEYYRKVNYCPECGQSLRWEEYEKMEL